MPPFESDERVVPILTQGFGSMVWTIVKMMLKSLSMGYEKISCGVALQEVDHSFGQVESAFLGG